MQHFMIDCYGAESAKLDDLKYIYSLLAQLADANGFKAIMPPMLIPYYYGAEAEDDGISAFALLRGGHMTIHTFSKRECYFADILYGGFINGDKVTNFFSSALDYKSGNPQTIDRRFGFDAKNAVEPGGDFGPHYLIKFKAAKPYTMERIYDILESLPAKINMTPIMRPYVMRDSVKNARYISGMTMIAESHIALHYDTESGQVFLDIFSCDFLEDGAFRDALSGALGEAAEKADARLIARGGKHYAKIARRSETVVKYSAWRDIING